MIAVLRKQNGMNIVGQGGKILLFAAPFLTAAILAHTYLPQIAGLPARMEFFKPLGYVLLFSGLTLWASAVFQLLTGFSKGKLVTTGAYGVVRNPIYSSVTFFILPAFALITLTWVYVVASFFLICRCHDFYRQGGEAAHECLWQGIPKLYGKSSQAGSLQTALQPRVIGTFWCRHMAPFTENIAD